MGKPNIAELAVAAWRLERWLENLNAERKMAAKKSLREIKSFLEASNIEIVDPLGWRFDPGLAVQVVNNEADDVDEEDLIIIQTNSPIIKENGAVIQPGKVILGQCVKEQKANNEIKETSQQTPAINTPDAEVQPSNDVIPDLIQSELGISESGSYWMRIFDLRATRPGYHAAIEIMANVDTDVIMMDEDAYKAFNQGYDKTKFCYAARAGVSLFVPPYPDVWYAFVYPPRGHVCHEYRFDMKCFWSEDKPLLCTEQASDQHCTETPNGDMPVDTASSTDELHEVNVTIQDAEAVNNSAATSETDQMPIANPSIVDEDEKDKEQQPAAEIERFKKMGILNKFHAVGKDALLKRDKK